MCRAHSHEGVLYPCCVHFVQQSFPKIYMVVGLLMLILVIPASYNSYKMVIVYVYNLFYDGAVFQNPHVIVARIS
jgi:hypothetical protein